MKFDKIFNQVLEEVMLKKEEIKKLKIESNNLISILKKNGLKARIGGSLAKGTLIKSYEKVDVDIFVSFKKESEMSNLKKILIKIKGFGKLKEVHGSRDYFQVEGENAVFEIIPVLDNKKSDIIRNVTDFSLKHVNYIGKKVKKNPGIAKEIILAKAFFKAQNLYGAESYVRGFSGYSLEVLVIYFGSFVKFLQEIQRSRVMDPENYFKSANEIKRELNESKISGPLILIDPTYKYRNVCAGLGHETFEKALIISKNFLKNPSLDFFKKREFDLKKLKDSSKKAGATLVEVSLETDRQEGDIAGTKMKKLFDFLITNLEKKQQKVVEKEFVYTNKGKKAKGYISLIENKEIEVRGPKKDLEEAVEKFKKVRGKTYFKDGFCYAKEKIELSNLFKDIIFLSRDMGAKAEMRII